MYHVLFFLFSFRILTIKMKIMKHRFVVSLIIQGELKKIMSVPFLVLCFPL